MIPDLKPNEWAAIIFGVVTMVFALAAHNRAKRSEELSNRSDDRSSKAEERSIQNEKNNALLMFEQKRQEVMQNCLELEIFNDRWAKAIAAESAAAKNERVTSILAASVADIASNVQEIRGIRESMKQVTASDSAEAARILEQQIGSLKQLKIRQPEDERKYSEYVEKARDVIRLGG